MISKLPGNTFHCGERHGDWCLAQAGPSVVRQDSARLRGTRWSPEVPPNLYSSVILATWCLLQPQCQLQHRLRGFDKPKWLSCTPRRAAGFQGLCLSSSRHLWVTGNKSLTAQQWQGCSLQDQRSKTPLSFLNQPLVTLQDYSKEPAAAAWIRASKWGQAAT